MDKPKETTSKDIQAVYELYRKICDPYKEIVVGSLYTPLGGGEIILDEIIARARHRFDIEPSAQNKKLLEDKVKCLVSCGAITQNDEFYGLGNFNDAYANILWLDAKPTHIKKLIQIDEAKAAFSPSLIKVFELCKYLTDDTKKEILDILYYKPTE